ncbi:hypothetical protein SDC9_125676 [bioreactor metagenome]|uniref:Uncharacterized protein n=1 Tax=bioreactor metagenome TaxID=1076179 RepID=A0A645CP42_9ZZZZ
MPSLDNADHPGLQILQVCVLDEGGKRLAWYRLIKIVEKSLLQLALFTRVTPLVEALIAEEAAQQGVGGMDMGIDEAGVEEMGSAVKHLFSFKRSEMWLYHSYLGTGKSDVSMFEVKGFIQIAAVGQ